MRAVVLFLAAASWWQPAARLGAVTFIHRAEARRGAGTRAVRAQALLHRPQEQAQGGALEIGIALQKVAQALGHREHHRFACLGLRFAASNCRTGSGGNT